MKKPLIIGMAIFVLLTCVSIISMWVYFSHRNPYKKEQEKLAILLGINIKDYPYERAFPIGYFYKVLKPGMSISEIHGLVQGYEKVLRCSTGEPAYYYSEVYYYFGTGDQDALPIELFYNEQGGFEDFQTEDDDSRTINTHGCEVGQIR
jgi:hypothetical protein